MKKYENERADIPMEAVERMNKDIIERKLEKIYIEILDIEDRIGTFLREKREQELKEKQARIEDEKISMKMREYDYTTRNRKLDDFNERF